jgi:hypothetical protein
LETVRQCLAGAEVDEVGGVTALVSPDTRVLHCQDRLTCQMQLVQLQ